MKSFLQKAEPGIIAGVFITLIFIGGYTLGQKNIPTASLVAAPSLINTENTADSKVDFSPFWKAWSIIDSNFVPASSSKKMDDQEKVWGAIAGLAASYGDPYTMFFPPEDLKQFQDDIQGNFEGIGIEIDIKDGILTVVSPLKGTPADRAGLRAKDQIIKIDGQMTFGMATSDATKLIKGAKGTPVLLTINREGKELEIKVVRDVIDVPVVEYTARPDGIFVIEISTFAANSAEKFRDALREFVKSGYSKMIIDLRGNPGGYLESSIDIASWFLPSDKIVVKEDFGNKEREGEVFYSKGYNIFTDNLKLAILVDQGSASASEILAGALEEHKKATLIGEKTFGKGSVQELIPLTGNSSLKVTIAHWYTPSGKSISLSGIDPNIVVKRTEEDRLNDKDPQLDKAIEFLTK